MEIERGPNQYVRCELCDAYATFENAAKGGWDWFTGSLPHTHHYCRKHANSPARNTAFTDSKKTKEPK